MPIEEAILAVALARQRGGAGGIHGFALAKELSDDGDASRLAGHGTLYKALGRLEKAGLLESSWEDAETAAIEGRPRRRLYSITAPGAVALAAARSSAGAAVRPRTADA